MVNRKSDKPQTIQSIERALDVLFAVSRAGEVGITEVARELDLHVPTVSNIVRTLAHRNVLANRGGRYSLGPALAALGVEDSLLGQLPRLAEEAVARLSALTGESGVAFVASGEGLELLGFCPAPDQLAVHFPPDLLRVPLGLRSGELLAAYRPPAVRRRMVLRHVSRSKGREATAADVVEWEGRFDAIRRAGWAGSAADRAKATVSVAAPVFDARGTVVATIGASCPGVRATRVKYDEMRESSCEEARAFSARLGYGAPEGE